MSGSLPKTWVVVPAALYIAGCAVGAQLLAEPADLQDYRAFRTARREGQRLARAQAYIERHPTGAWVGEVRTIFDAEEAAWFEAAKQSRRRARDYIVELPGGPHIDAARSLMLLFDERQDDFDTLELLAAARRTQATLDEEADRRRHLGDLLLGEVAALLDPAAWGAPLDDLPQPMRAVLRGPVAPTWGGAASDGREDRIYFVIPTPEGAQARSVDVRFRIFASRGRVVQGVIEGEDLFVRWAEGLSIRVLDPTLAADRAAASAVVADVIAGALEARMPADRCGVPPQPGEILARGCEGWGASVIMGAKEGETDTIAVRGPQRDGARDRGMR